MRTQRALLFVILAIAIGFELAKAYQPPDEAVSWLRDFLLLYGILLVLSIPSLISAAWARALLLPVTIITCVASMPFGSDISLRILLLGLLVVVASGSENIAFLSVSILIHTVWAFAYRDLVTVFPDAVGQSNSTSLVLLTGMGVFLWVVFSVNIRRMTQINRLRTEVNALEQSVERLTEANTGFSTFAAVARKQASAEERNRITYEIHDDIGYILTNITMLSESALSTPDSLDVKLIERLSAIRQQAKTGLYETRRVLRSLRETEHESAVGLNAIIELLKVYETATGVGTHLDVAVPRNHIESRSVFHLVYHFIQESLTNAFRHGRANSVVVRLLRDGPFLVVTVRDNGVGVGHAITEGIGLKGMRDELSRCGGSLNYNNDAGFTVTARIPLRAGS